MRPRCSSSGISSQSPSAFRPSLTLLAKTSIYNPRDVLVVRKNPAFYTVLGALGHNAEVQFRSDRLNLVEAMGGAEGLLDARADPTGVFVFRFEDRKLVGSLCPTCIIGDFKDTVPVVYRLDMNRGDSFFIGQKFQMSDHDVIYVSNSPRVQTAKFLAMLRDAFSPVTATAIAARAVEN